MTNVEMSSTAATRVPEVVTEAVVRYVDLPFGVDRFALVTLDNGRDHARPNTPSALAAWPLWTARWTASRRPTSSGWALPGKPSAFAVGADLKAVETVRSREQGLAIGRTRHACSGVWAS